MWRIRSGSSYGFAGLFGEDEAKFPSEASTLSSQGLTRTVNGAKWALPRI
jgi:hypothetical protein